MEGIVLSGALAAAAAFLAVFFGIRVAAEGLRRRSMVLAAQGRDLSLRNLAGLQMRSGVGPLEPAARVLMRIPPVARVAGQLAETVRARGWEATAQSALSSFLAVLLGLFILAWLVAGTVIAGFAAALCACAVLVVALQSSRDRRKEAMREEVPNALELMSACFSSGFTLLQTFQQISRDIPGPLGRMFGRSAHILETGGDVPQALECLRRGSDMAELSFVVAALDIQHQSGGALQKVLASASRSVKGELALRRSLRVQTAQAKLSARIVILMPFVLIAIFCVVSPDFLQPFFSSLAGYGLLALAIIMQVAGIVLVQRALAVEGVS